jgi:hypothetical protein
VDQTLLVAGPDLNVYLPQASERTTGGSNFSGLGPTSYFQISLPVFGSSATRKPRPVLLLYNIVPAISCSSAPPPNTTLPPAMIGEAIRTLNQWAPGNVDARLSTIQRSLPVSASRQYLQPPVSAK